MRSGTSELFPVKLFTPHGIRDILKKEDNFETGNDKNLAKNERNLSWCVEGRKPKKLRTTFSAQQVNSLEKMFEQRKYINCAERSYISSIVGVTEQQVKIWFQNRRTKWKKQENITSQQAALLMKTKPRTAEL